MGATILLVLIGRSGLNSDVGPGRVVSFVFWTSLNPDAHHEAQAGGEASKEGEAGPHSSRGVGIQESVEASRDAEQDHARTEERVDVANLGNEDAAQDQARNDAGDERKELHARPDSAAALFRNMLDS
jgi:hypothetical protein